MPKHISQTFAAIPNADRTAEALCGSLRDYALSIDTNQTEYTVNFGEGRAIIRPRVCGLDLRVEAEDLATFFGVRSLLQVALSQASNHQASQLEWHSVGDELCEMISRRAGTGRC